MGDNKLWLLLVTLGLMLSLVACGPKATPVVEEATPTPAEATPTPKPVEATPTPATPEGVTEVEPNNGPAEATEISMGLSIGVLTNDEDEDWYKFEVPNGHVLSVAFTPAEDAEPMDVSLFTPDQEEIWWEYGVGPTVTKSTTGVMNSSSGGTYYVRVSAGYGSYSIELSSRSQDDADSGGDAGDKVVAALEVQTGLAFSGQLGDFDEEDWYKFEVPNGHVLSVAFTPAEDAEPMDVSLFTPDQEEIWWEYGVGPTVTKSTTGVMNSSSGGTYYVRVSAGYGSYSIELSSRSQDDADSGGDAGDKVVDALEVQMGLAFSGQLGDFDEEDWYKFTLTEEQMVSFTPGEDAEPMDVSLFTPDQEEIWWEYGVGPTVTVGFEITEVVRGSYYIQVAYGSGSYTIEIK